MVIKNEAGEKTSETEEVKRVWRDHFQNIYRSRGEDMEMVQFPELKTEELCEGWVTPAVTKEEVVSAMKSPSSFKTSGRDNVPVELLEAGGDAVRGLMQRL